MDGDESRFYADDVTRASLGDWSSPIYSDRFWGPERSAIAMFDERAVNRPGIVGGSNS